MNPHPGEKKGGGGGGRGGGITFKGSICFNYTAFPKTGTASVMSCWIRCRNYWMKLYG